MVSFVQCTIPELRISVFQGTIVSQYTFNPRIHAFSAKDTPPTLFDFRQKERDDLLWVLDLRACCWHKLSVIPTQ